MATSGHKRSGPRYDKEEFARRGDAIYDREISPSIEKQHPDQFVAIDIETGNFELADNDMKASDQLRARVPDAQIWLRRVGSRHARHFGPRGRSES